MRCATAERSVPSRETNSSTIARSALGVSNRWGICIELSNCATHNRRSLWPSLAAGSSWAAHPPDLTEDYSRGSRNRDLAHFNGFFPFADCPCLIAFCFLVLSLSFLPPLSPIVNSLFVGSRHSGESAVDHCRRSALRCPFQTVAFCAVSTNDPIVKKTLPNKFLTLTDFPTIPDKALLCSFSQRSISPPQYLDLADLLDKI